MRFCNEMILNVFVKSEYICIYWEFSYLGYKQKLRFDKCGMNV